MLRRSGFPFAAGLFIALATSAPAAALDCGQRLERSVTLDRDLVCTGDGLVVAADDLEVDCAGHAIRGPVEPELAGIRVDGRSGVTIRRCRIIGFWRGVEATAAPRLTVIGSHLAGGHADGILVSQSPEVSILGNEIRGPQPSVRVYESERPRIEDNLFEASTRFGRISVARSRDAILRSNRFDGRGTIGMTSAGAAVVEDNTFVGPSASISVFGGHDCRVARNRMHVAHGPDARGGSVTIRDARRCEVADNLLGGAGGFGLLVAGDDLDRGENQIVRNTIGPGGFGMFLQGPRGDVVEGNRITGTLWGILALPAWDGEAGTWAGGDLARIVGNTIVGATFGIELAEIGGLTVQDNVVREGEVGAFEIVASAPGHLVNVYEGNRFEENTGYGMALVGASPVLRRNVFAGNGGGEEELSEDTYPLPLLLGGTRAAVAFVPFAGSDNNTFDDGDPGNDRVPAPVIGAPDAPNLFRGNVGHDIYALDARPANAPTLLDDNRFQGRAARWRQDWLGLVRVEDEAGAPVADARVVAFEASGAAVFDASSDSAGTAPAGLDPTRSWGLADFEPGGPVARWPILTERIVDARGRIHVASPHLLRAERGAASGCAVYTWNGEDDPGESGTSVAGRYQTAVLRLGSPCPAASPWNRRAGAHRQ